MLLPQTYDILPMQISQALVQLATSGTGERSVTRRSRNLEPQTFLDLPSPASLACLAPYPKLGMARAFGLFVFIDELFQFIEFGWSDILKGDSECVLSDPLHTRCFDQERFRCSRKD